MEQRGLSLAEATQEVSDMANVMGALIGAAIDRRDGDSGVKGAVLGAAAQSAIRLAIPVAITYGIGKLVQFGVRKAWQNVAGRGAARASDGAGEPAQPRRGPRSSAADSSRPRPARRTTSRPARQVQTPHAGTSADTSASK